jgi:hypothetical protein
MKQSRHLIIRTGVLLIITMLSAASCRKIDTSGNTVVYYRIENQSDYTIKVISDKFWSNSEDPVFNIDTIVHYSPGESRDLVVIYGMNRDFNFETGDSLEGIGILKIYKNDTIPSVYNYLETKYWSYSKPASYKIQYTLEITNASFNR